MTPIILEGRQRTPEWHQAKCGVISGTRFAAAMAGRDTAARANLIADLAVERVYGVAEDEDRYVSPAMQHGIDIEDEAFAWYAFGTDEPVMQAMFVLHGAYSFIGVSPDLLVGGNGMAQVKCPERSAHVELICKRKLPSKYRWQVQGEMWVCGRGWSDFVSYHKVIGGEVLRVMRDDAAIKELELACLRVHAEAEEVAAQLNQRRLAA